jgi:flagella basal body P-ring formation protein FlgA
MKVFYDNKVVLTNTNNEKQVEAEIDNFKEQKSFDAYLVTNKIPMRWNGKIYVGNAHGMEFTSPGPVAHTINEGRKL